MIDVKILQDDEVVHTASISTDPSEVDLINLLSISGKSDIFVLGSIMGWDVIHAGDERKIMVLGSPPYIDDHVKKRVSCTLTDEQVKGLVKFLKSGWDNLNLN